MPGCRVRSALAAALQAAARFSVPLNFLCLPLLISANTTSLWADSHTAMKARGCCAQLLGKKTAQTKTHFPLGEHSRVTTRQEVWETFCSAFCYFCWVRFPAQCRVRALASGYQLSFAGTAVALINETHRVMHITPEEFASRYRNTLPVILLNLTSSWAPRYLHAAHRTSRSELGDFRRQAVGFRLVRGPLWEAHSCGHPSNSSLTFETRDLGSDQEL